jgi:CheY-like chemotaxis protein
MVTDTAPADGVDTEPGSRSEPLGPCDRRRVLVVDDDRAIVRLFETLIAGGLPDVRIDSAMNGREAVDTFSVLHPSVVVMDLHMPVMDGRTAFVEIQNLCRVRNWEMPAVIFCTGFVPPDGVRKAVDGDPRHGLLSKPVDFGTLLDAIKRRLDRR